MFMGVGVMGGVIREWVVCGECKLVYTSQPIKLMSLIGGANQEILIDRVE